MMARIDPTTGKVVDDGFRVDVRGDYFPKGCVACVEKDTKIAQLEAYVAKLEGSLDWTLAAYDGPDYPRNAEHTTWRLRSKDECSYTVKGQNPPKSIREAIERGE
jgi:hypothetical protein